MPSEDELKLIMWFARCNAVAGSAFYHINGPPDLQVKVLTSQFKSSRSRWVGLAETVHSNLGAVAPQTTIISPR
jgi:hypothetical protein